VNILALDISTNVGWACGDGTVAGTSFGTKAFADQRHDLGRMSFAFSAWLACEITERDPGMVAIERGFFRGKPSYMLAGLIWDAHRVAYVRSIPRREYIPQDIKGFATGSRKADKPAVMKAVRALGFDIATDHEADAVALLLLTIDNERMAAA
jgi:Holliday junction resolvasome RuvABC endonuclease subunit